MRSHLNYMLASLLTKLRQPRPPVVICKRPEPPLTSKLTPLPSSQKYRYVKGGYLKNYPTKPTKWPHITSSKLPEKPTDIKGVDHSAYCHVERKQMFKKMPTLKTNQFFVLKFFPYYHHLSLVRKSNIAYTFSNNGGSPLNDYALYDAFKKYRGKYAKMSYFRTTPNPKDKAVARAKFRKLVKRSLFEALHEVVPEQQKDVKLVSGIWFFKFDLSPRTEEDYKQVKLDLLSAVKTVYKDRRFQKLTSDMLARHNKEQNYGESLVSDASHENNPGAAKVPGYFPKLPFLRKQSMLL